MSIAQLSAKAARFRAQGHRLHADELRMMAKVYRLEGSSDFADTHLKLAASYDKLAIEADKDADYWEKRGSEVSQ